MLYKTHLTRRSPSHSLSRWFLPRLSLSSFCSFLFALLVLYCCCCCCCCFMLLLASSRVIFPFSFNALFPICSVLSVCATYLLLLLLLYFSLLLLLLHPFSSGFMQYSITFTPSLPPSLPSSPPSLRQQRLKERLILHRQLRQNRRPIHLRTHGMLPSSPPSPPPSLHQPIFIDPLQIILKIRRGP